MTRENLGKLVATLTLGLLAACATLSSRGKVQAVTPDPYAGMQHYTDGRQLVLPPTPAMGANEDACSVWRDKLLAMQRDNIVPLKIGPIPEFNRPELMAIGDSLFNGVQSLRINWFLSEWSAPSLVAIRLGLIQEVNAHRTGQRTFYGPEYPSESASPADTNNNSYGFNLESIPGLFHLAGVPNKEAKLLEDLAFQYQPPDGRPMVDNIAYLGATSYDLLYWTPYDYRDRARKEIAELRRGVFGARSLAGAVFDANAAFVLDPTRNPCLEHLTPIQQVELRHPHRVIISVGANDGMYSMAFSSAPTDQLSCTDRALSQSGHPSCSGKPIAQAMLTDYINNVRFILQRLAVVHGLETVYLNNLPYPSRTANLVPVAIGNSWFWYNDLMSRPGKTANDLSGKVFSTANEVAQSDALIDQVNHKLSELVKEMNECATTQFILVDVNGRLGNFDAKRCDTETPQGSPREVCRAAHGLLLTKARFQGGNDVTLDNRPIRFDGETGTRSGLGFETKIVEGGLFSFDNMHLSSVGYEIMASRIVGAMETNGDRGVLPADDPQGRDLCNNRAAEPPPYGACAALLSTTPGWSYEDATRRDYNFLRTDGLQETNDRKRLSSRVSFVGELLHLFPKPEESPDNLPEIASDGAGLHMAAHVGAQ